MADIPCRICGEPADAYGVEHGDMTAAEALLFRRGAGCPNCEGHAPEAVTAEAEYEHAKAVMVGGAWDAPEEYTGAFEVCEGAKAPAWDIDAAEDEVSTVLWTCKGCGVRAVRRPDSANEHRHGKGELCWVGGERVHYYRGAGPFPYGECLMHEDQPEETAENPPLEGSWCPGCVGMCDGPGCTAPTFLRSDLEAEHAPDTYDAGRAFGSEQYWGSTLCIGCFETELGEAQAAEEEE